MKRERYIEILAEVIKAEPKYCQSIKQDVLDKLFLLLTSDNSAPSAALR